jgi:hypothetical protein
MISAGDARGCEAHRARHQFLQQVGGVLMDVNALPAAAVCHPGLAKR